MHFVKTLNIDQNEIDIQLYVNRSIDIEELIYFVFLYAS